MDKNNTRNYICSVDSCSRAGYAKGVCSKHYQYRLRVGRERKPNFEERFWGYVTKGSDEKECWAWSGPKDANGYGIVSTRVHPDFTRNSVEAHRISLYLHGEPLLEGLVVDHICRNPECVNIKHLRQVSVGQNSENKSIYSKRAKSGYRGVRVWPGGWRAEVMYRGKRYDGGGFFKDVEEAAIAVRELRLSLLTHNDGDKEYAETNA